MKKIAKTRVIAYIIDMLIVTMIVSLIGSFFRTKNMDNLTSESTKIMDMYINQEITTDTYLHRLADVSHDLDKEYIYINIIEAMTLIGYFVIIPYCFNGQTLGKKLFKIKTISSNNELSYNNFIIRALLINGLGCILILMSFVYLLPSMPYLILKAVVEFAEFVFLVTSFIQMFRHEKGIGMHDKLAKTQVIESN